MADGPNRPFPDGYCGGGELPDDLALDRMVYPEDCMKPSAGQRLKWDYGRESYEDFLRRQEAADAEEQLSKLQRDRRFEITEGSVTGRHPGPPRTP